MFHHLKTTSLKINGQLFQKAIPPAMTLLEFLREEALLTGTKRGCDTGDCGCCTVLLNGKPVLSCLLLAVEAEGKKITTIEGIAKGSELHPVQEAFVQNGAIQCGFCTPAMVLSAVSLLENNPSPNQEEIKECVSGTICRCTGYTKIEKAITIGVRTGHRTTNSQPPFHVIGKPTPLVSSQEKVTGRAKYTDDLRLVNPLIVKILRSPYACAKIKSINTKKAENRPGVRAILTGKDFHKTFGVLAISKDEPAIAKENVRYIGEAVAAVAADTEAIALLALNEISIEYEQEEPCFLPEEARQKTNFLHKSVEQKFGDPEKGFREAQVVVEKSFRFEPVTHAFTEPHATQVEIDSLGNLTVYSATQVPHYLHRALAEVLEIPMHQIRVIKPHLGGGFGGKGDPFPHEMIVAKMALITGRNAKINFTREEVFINNHGRHPTEMKMKLGFHPEKGLTALTADVLIDGGAYASFGVVTTYYNGVLLKGPYQIENFAFHCDRVYTNKPTCGAMRGHGGVNPRFASEVLFDMACEKAKVDPLETRLKWVHDENSLIIGDFRITSCALKKGLEMARQKTGWDKKYGKLPFGKGIGVACGFFISGSALPIHRSKMPQSTVRLTIDYDGAVTVYSGASDIGQGSDTVLAQMVAEVLGIPFSLIKVISADTRLCPIDLGSYSSRVTFMAGNAARNAAIRMRRILVESACQILERPEPHYSKPSPPENFFQQGQRKPDFDNHYLGPNPNYSDGFEFRDLKIIPPSGPSLDYFDAVRKALEGPGILQTRGVYVSPKMGGDFKGSGAGLSPSYSYTAFITEVTVDPETGFIKVDKVTAAHDCGTVLNPLGVEGQIEGSIHMGLGQALMEKMVYDKGVLQNASFLDYKIPCAFEQPEIEILSLPSSESEGPFGGKEVGEGALAPILPSVANAVYDAVGVRLTEIPMTPDRVLAAIEKRGQS